MWGPVLGVAMVAIGAIMDAHAQTSAPPAVEGPGYSVTCVEVMPSAPAAGR